MTQTITLSSLLKLKLFLSRLKLLLSKLKLLLSKIKLVPLWSINVITMLIAGLLLNFTVTTSVFAEDTGLCPEDFSEGIVTTTMVECYETGGSKSRESAEFDRIEFEALCNSTPRATVTRSDIFETSSGRFFAEVTCTIRRVVPAGTVACPAGTDEIQRAFSTVFCQNFGSAFPTIQGAQADLTQQAQTCSDLSGTLLASMVKSGTLEDETEFFYAESACAIPTVTVDVIECPYSFEETDRDESSLLCEFSNREYQSLAEANAASAEAQNICNDLTADLGRVDNFNVGVSSIDEFFATVVCEIRIPRYSEFEDAAILRTCDASCTEDVQQTRRCLNGGTVGGPGCFDLATQTITRRCNTGTDPAGLCPFPVSTTTVLPLLILDEEED